MAKEDIYIVNKNIEISGFNFKPGFVALVDEGENIVAATSGWKCNRMMYVYRPTTDGAWIGSWEDAETFPIDETLEAIQEFKEGQELEKALNYAKNKKLHISEHDIEFTDVVPGRMCNNGGDYGFYTRYCPILEHPGIYQVYTETTCDFDKCGTGYEGIRALTIREYKRLRKASDEIETAGSLY